ncbi:hypothetical protein HYR69_02485 [Candidatus Sumerlaeota bacterium]|nr:hypothetical protein [Candidatus Sumerlaeota bacterium]
MIARKSSPAMRRGLVVMLFAAAGGADSGLKEFAQEWKLSAERKDDFWLVREKDAGPPATIPIP